MDVFALQIKRQTDNGIGTMCANVAEIRRRLTRLSCRESQAFPATAGFGHGQSVRRHVTRFATGEGWSRYSQIVNESRKKTISRKIGNRGRIVRKENFTTHIPLRQYCTKTKIPFKEEKDGPLTRRDDDNSVSNSVVEGQWTNFYLYRQFRILKFFDFKRLPVTGPTS